MRRFVLFLVALLASIAVSAVPTAPELFLKVKEQVKAGSWQEALKTLEALDAEASKPGNEGMRQQLVAPTAFYRAVCEANLDQAEKARSDFEVFLTEQPNASVDRGMYSKKAVAAFEDARKAAAAQSPARGPDSGPSLFKAFQEFKAPANIGEKPSEFWAEGPVKWIMTASEKRSWSELSSGSERAEFIEKFWQARNPKPDSEDNVFKTTFDRRVAFADAYFVLDEKQRGSLTDRGMVFVLLGPPTWGGRKPLQTGDDASDSAGLSTAGRSTSSKSGSLVVYIPGAKATDSAGSFREIWHYRRELLPKGVSYHQVDFEFITRKDYGRQVLQREDAVLATLEAAMRGPL